MPPKMKKPTKKVDDVQPEADNVVVKKKLTQVIKNEDCIEGMRLMEDDSVDIVICDPPYNIGKDGRIFSMVRRMD